MSNAPRQPVEDALRDYAEARRRDAGEPFAMPPHLRSQLHREIARLDAARSGRKPNQQENWWQWLSRPWAWGAMAALMVLGVLTWRSLDSVPAVRSLAKAEVAVVPASGRAELAPPPSPATRAGPFDTSVSAPNVGVASASLTRAPETKAKEDSAPRPTAAPAAAALEEKMTDSAASVSTRPAARYAARDRMPTLQQNFRQEPAPAQNAAWSNFRIEQVGGGLQVVDAEGSAYPARLAAAGAPVPTAVTALVGGAGRSLQSERTRGNASLANAPATNLNRAPASPDPQAFTLVAEGTNARSQQRVMLTGNLVLTNARGLTGNAPEFQVTNAAALQFLLSNARFEGQVTLDRTNQIPVVAVPAGP